jgi:immunity protein Imm1 of predicted polymorphic toxin system
VTYTLDVWYYRDKSVVSGKPVDNPVPVTSRSGLAELLAYMLEHEQPHPPQIVARERPRVGPRNQADTLIKVAFASPERMGALVFVSPESWQEPDEGDTSTGIYVTRGESSGAGMPPLFIDNATKTLFPADAAIPFDRVLAALEEFRQTGERPTCVDWQESEVY